MIVHGFFRRTLSIIDRLYRQGIYTLYHRWRTGNQALPVLFGNSFPKSGTHLLLHALRGIEAIEPFLYRGSFVHTYDDHRLSYYMRSSKEILRDIQRLLPGEIAGGHVFATSENKAALIQPLFVNFFIYRDPRDVVVSHAFYVTQISSRHRLNPYYTEKLRNLEERITVSVEGIPDNTLQFPNIFERFEPYLGWLELDQVMKIRFEDFVQRKEATIGQILAHVQNSGYKLTVDPKDAISALTRAIVPEKSPTFREGRTGSWRKHFTEKHKQVFKQVAGDLLIRLGYEKDQDW